MIVRLNDKERSVVAALAARADTPLTEVAKILGLPVHAVRYALDRLIEQKVVRYCPFVNVFALGYTPYSVYVRLVPEWRAKSEQIVEWLRTKSAVSWVAQLGGSYDLCISILAESPVEVTGFLESFATEVGDCISQKAVVSQTKFCFYPAHYWQSREHKPPVVTYEGGGTPVELDGVDKKILSGIVQYTFTSHRDLARQLGMAFSTLETRLERLSRSGVLPATVYLVNSPILGIQPYKILVHVKGLRAKVADTLHSFCLSAPQVTTIISNLGSWDYEVGIEVEENAMAVQFLDQLHKILGASLGHAELVTHFRDLKLSTFPFSSGKGLLSAAGGI